MDIRRVRAQALPCGARLDSLEVRGVLGVGGFGVTYKAWDHQLACDVAIKEYFPASLACRAEDGTTLNNASEEDRGDFETGLSRFLHEARTLAKFRDPSIVRVSRFLEANGTAYLVMDLEVGNSLEAIILRHGPIDEPTARALLPQLLRGLAVVHEAGILHRDIKPSNILIRESGTPVLLDFGAAREAIKGDSGELTAMLTPGYAPIEQYGDGGRQGPWSDLYALGATFYHAMVGRPPQDCTQRLSREAEGAVDSIACELRSARRRFEPPLLKIVFWLMRPHAKDRPQNAGKVLATLERLGVATTAIEASPGPSAHEAPTLSATARSASVAPASPPGGAEPARAIPPDALASVAACLAEYLGPIAGLLVERAAARTRDSSELHALLATEIDDPDERERFLLAARRGASGLATRGRERT